MLTQVMQTKDALSSREGKLFIIIDGESHEICEILKFNAKIKYTKVEVKRLNHRMEGSKIVGAKGEGEMTYYFHRPEIRALALRYLKSGRSPIFDALVVNEDSTSAAGNQTVLIKNIVPDETLLTQLAADTDDVLKDESTFTFDDFDFLSQFDTIQG